jgi:hypothetical protein
MPLERGDLVPQFVVDAIDGTRVDYSAIWQRRNLLLIVWPGSASPDDAARYVATVAAPDDLAAFDAAIVMTSEPIAGVAAPAVIVADRWGEVYLIARAETIEALPPGKEVREWLQSVAHECPECQGEVR